MIEPWCVLLASREEPRQCGVRAVDRSVANARDPLTASAHRAATVASLDRIAAVIAAPGGDRRQNFLQELGIRNLFVQPKHQGTAHEVLLALLLLESHVAESTAVLFLPADHIVNDEEVMTNSLLSMVEWIAEEPRPVYLLGAIPQGPHDQLGYIVPWHGSMVMPTGVYEFVERPDVRRARKLINEGGLWNTFIFGGTIAALLDLYRPGFDRIISQLREALQSDDIGTGLARAYDGLFPLDFSRDVLEQQIDKLSVLRLLNCGWWPLKSPSLNPTSLDASASRAGTHRNSGGHAPLE